MAKVQKISKRLITATVLAVFAAFLGACGGAGGPSNSVGGVDPNETAATVNGKVIKMEDVDRAMKQQTQGQESRLSPLELAGARLQVLQSLIEQEVMYQKAEKEGTVPSEDDVTAEINKRKVDSKMSAEEFDKQMKQAGFDEASFRENVKKGLAIQKLVDKVTGKIEAPKDQEIQDFYNGNKDAFVKRKGVKLAAIVIDPSNSGEGDSTTDDQSARLKANDIINRLKAGQDFAQLARENSEDQSKFQGGDLGYLTEDDLKQAFGEQTAGAIMSQVQIGGLATAQSQGKLFILKVQDKSDKDEPLTLDSPGVRQQVADALVNNRKQLLTASYQAIAMNEAKIENYLAKKVVDNPNELSGARPAGAATPAAANTNTPATTPANTAANTKAAPANTTSGAKPATTPAATAARPAVTTPAATRPAANAAATSPANK
ncbi:MAG TPA: SurA N-terminal domain-containing protein [Pyrinomonadaceae bacterium]|nr:SurA N-terminal domain-containing protein [Pyrinomonadaceae bacterium]